MMDDVFGDLPLRFVVVVASGVQVTLEAREIAARNFEPDAVTRTEVVTRDLQINLDFVSLAFLHPYLLVVTLAVTGAQDSFVNVEGCAVRIDINELRREIGVI